MTEMSITELARAVNGGVDVSRMVVRVAGIRVDVKKRRRIVSQNGQLIYQENNRNIGLILPGDVLYLKNEVIEVV